MIGNAGLCQYSKNAGEEGIWDGQRQMIAIPRERVLSR
jgi:hypothetical protein